MVKRGPKPKPTALKLIDGERKDRINRNEPKPLMLSEYNPTVEMGAEMEQIFHDYVKKLSRQRIMTENDVDLLSVYVREFCWYRHYMMMIEREGSILENDKGNKYEHPACNLANKHLKNVIQIAPHFGFSPSTRSRIAVIEPENTNPFQSLRK